jgi:16S rRNA (adenine1518-N6/adenine1519-N6)-dimethyltransferase
MIRQKRSLGQVFLKDKKYIEKIINCLDLEDKKVLEIGPGKGEITYLIGKEAKKLYCLEIDQRFYSFLKKKFSPKSNVEIICADILKFDLSRLGRKITVFGNVPYHISSKLIEYLIFYRKYITKAYLTLQKEFAQKLIAKSGDGQYTFLSCYAQYYAKVEKLFCIPAGAFSPHPKVDSTFISLEFVKQPPYKAKSEDFLFKIIRRAFSNRRKKVINSISLAGDKNLIFEKIKVDSGARAQDLSLKEYIKIANCLYQR